MAILHFTILIIFTCLFSKINSQPLPNYSVQVSAEVQASPPQIKLKWPAVSTAIGYGIMRKGKDDPTWPNTFHAILPGSATTFIDNSVTVGQGYEYLIIRNFKHNNDTLPGLGYIYSGIQLPAQENRGIVILVIDTTHEATLITEINRLESDLMGDGWQVKKIRINRNDSPPSVRSKIQALYNQNPTETKAVFLLGRVPVPYSGNLNPDAHPDHQGAWPADVYYGEMNSTWTDVSVNNTTATRTENKNVPGDGKFDQSVIPSDIELWVGRVDLANMPAFNLPEAELLRRYLDKNHKFRHGQLTALRRGLIDANFGAMDGPITHFIANGLRNFSAFFGADSIKQLDWFTTLNNNSYLWAYGFGAGSFTSASGVGNTNQFASTPTQAVFTLLFGSYFGDWDSNNNLLRAPLASNTHALTCAWAGRPYWVLHHMAMGECIGYSTRLTQNNGPITHPILPWLYDHAAFPRGVHIALMGDPTLRMHIVPPPSNLVVTATNNNRHATLNWQASSDPNVLGYYVYRYDTAQKKYVRISNNLITSTTFTDTLPYAGHNSYMVRAYKLEESASGTYYNLSQGIFGNINLPLQIQFQLTKNQYCIPESFSFTFSTSGPFRHNNQFNIQLSDASGSFNSPTTLQSVTGFNGGTYQLNLPTSLLPGTNYRIRILATNPQFTSNISAPLTFHKTPPPTATSNSPICNGGNLLLSASPIPNLNNVTYLWSGPLSFSSTLQNPTISNASSNAAGVYSLVAIANGCTSPVATISVSINSLPTPSFSTNSPLCPGDTLFLQTTSIPGATYLFSGPNGFAVTTTLPSTFIPNMNNSRAGTYSLQVLIPNCAPLSATASVTIKNTVPTPPINHTSPTCQGGSLTLSASQISNAIYLWNGPGGFSNTGTNNTVTINNLSLSQSGEYSLQIIFNGCTSSLNTKNIIVQPKPNAPSLSINPSNVCVGKNATITTSSTANTYLWNIPGIGSVNTSTPSYTLSNTSLANNGNVSLAVVVNGCTSEISTTSLVIYSLPSPPVVTAPSTLCQGENLTIQLNANAQSYYLWGSQNWNASGTQTTYTISAVTPAQSGVYSVVSIVNGCTSNAATFNLQVFATPATPTLQANYSFCENSNLIISLPSLPNNGNYHWIGPNNFNTQVSSTLQRTAAQLSFSGTYQVIAVVNGCSSQIATTNISILPLPTLQAIIAPQDACIGETISFTPNPINPNYQYYWQGPLGFQSTQNAPIFSLQSTNQSGPYSAVAISSGCTSLAVIHNLVVKPIPNSPQIVGTTTYCAGQNIVLTLQGNAQSYYWLLPEGEIETQNPLVRVGVTTAQSGVYKAWAISQGCTSAASSINITVHPIPESLPIQGPSEICTGQNLSLSAPPRSGVTYIWTPPQSISYTSTTPSFSQNNIRLSDGGTYSLEIVVNGCTSAASTYTPTIKPTPAPPSLEGNTTLCEGSSLILTTEDIITNATYLWYLPNMELISSSVPRLAISEITLPQAGQYGLRIVVNGCTSQLTQKRVTVLAKPIIEAPLYPSNVCNGNRYQFVAQPWISGLTYLWKGPNNFSAIGPVVSFVSTQSEGTSSFEVVAVQNGCTSATQYFTIIHNSIPTLISFLSPSSLCQGDSLKLLTSALEAELYVWKGPNGLYQTTTIPALSIPNIDLIHEGEYEVVAIQGACTSNALRRSIRVQPIPLKPELRSTSTLCEGRELTINAISNYPNMSYYWQGPNGLSITTNSSHVSIPSVTTTQSGKYTVQSVLNGCTSLKAETYVHVIPTPATPQVTSNSPICLGGTIQFQFSNLLPNSTIELLSPTNQSYYTSQNSLSLPASSILQAGLYQVRSWQGECVSKWDSIYIWLFENPTLDSLHYAKQICSGQPLDLKAFVTPATAYMEWKGPASIFATGPRLQIPAAGPQHSGTYTFSYTIAGCSTREKTFNILVVPTPERPILPSSLSACQGSSVNLAIASTSSNSLRYQWITPQGQYLEGERIELGNLNPTMTGTYSVVAIAINCTSAIATTELTVRPVPSAPVVRDNSPICVGQTLILTAITENTAPIIWRTPKNTTVEIGETWQIPNASLEDAGVYSAYTVANNCTSGTTSINVRILPAPPPPAINISSNRVCEGGNIRLSTNPVASTRYIWSGPAGFSSTDAVNLLSNLTPQASGTYSLVSINNGCTSQVATVSLSVIPIPQIQSVSKDTTLCSGQTLILSASSNLAGVAWQWNGPISSTTATLTRNNISTLQSGIYTVVAIANGCTSRPSTVRVTVNPTPPTPVILHNAPFCSGSTLRLNTNEIADQYLWSGPNGWNAFQKEVSIENVTSPGIFSLQTVLRGCSSGVATANISIWPTPTITAVTSNAPLCEGQTLQLSAASSIPGATFQWWGPTAFRATTPQPTVSSVSTLHAGTYSVVAIAGRCSSTVATLPVEILPRISRPPVIHTNSPICQGDNLVVSTTFSPGFNYLWSGPNNFSSTSSQINIPNAPLSAAGTYILRVESGNCGSHQARVEVEILPRPEVVITAPSQICSGQNFSLSATLIPNARYLWQGPNGFSATTPSFTINTITTQASGTYQLQLALGQCIANYTHTLTVITRPPMPSISGISSICEGQPLILTAHSPHAVYWQGPNGFTSNQKQLNWQSAQRPNSGVYLAQAIENGCSSEAASIRVEVQPMPHIHSLHTTAPTCSGQALFLGAEVSNALITQWQGPRGMSQNTPSWALRAAPEHSGIYTFTAITGNCTASQTINVQITPTPNIPFVSPLYRVCVGQSLTLTANSENALTYFWQGPSNFTATTQSPVLTITSSAQAGTYTVWAIHGNCTSAAATTQIEIIAGARPQIVGQKTICEGQVLQLSVENPLAGIQYRWYTPRNQIITSHNLVIPDATLSHAGVYSLHTEPNLCGIEAITETVTIISQPRATITTNAPICEGNNLWLRTIPEAGATYTYYSPTGTLFTGPEVEISQATPELSGTWLLKVEKGPCVAQFTIPIAVQSKPQVRVTSNSPVCEGSLLQLSTSELTNAQYLWQGPNNFISAEQNPSLIASAASAGIYTFHALQGSCMVGPLTVNVQVVSMPTITASNNGPLCVGGTIALSATSVTNASYFWTGPYGFTSTISSPIIPRATTANSGIYTVSVRVGRCAVTTTTSVSVTECQES
ncbi:MAG: hypothetical protein RML72_03055, partial [Bacteroidia bacterium]|nr:hypothetical protein [Bacteroidia bacterium]